MNNYLSYVLPWGLTVARYVLLAGIPFVIFYVLFPNAFAKNKIQARWAKQTDFLREILHSLQNTFIFAGVGILILKTPLREYTQLYAELNAYPWWWMPISIFLALVVHDTYFYWMHRTVHHPSLFRHVHLLHHKSVNPSPWASYSFHLFEGVLEALIAPIILVLIPMHPLALLLFTIIAFVINVYGHLGYEIAPKWLRHTFLFEILVTSTFHNLHHARFKGNYGLYFRMWDRWMGTEHPQYVEQYDQIQARRFGEATPAASWKKAFFLLVFLTSMVGVHAQEQTGIEGTWKDPEKGGTILIYEQDGMYHGQLIASDDSEENKRIQERDKIILLKDFKKKSDTQYCCGTIFQPREKRMVSGTLILEDAQTLKVNGKVGIFTGSRTWVRLE